MHSQPAIHVHASICQWLETIYNVSVRTRRWLYVIAFVIITRRKQGKRQHKFSLEMMLACFKTFLPKIQSTYTHIHHKISHTHHCLSNETWKIQCIPKIRYMLRAAVVAFTIFGYIFFWCDRTKISMECISVFEVVRLCHSPQHLWIPKRCFISYTHTHAHMRRWTHLSWRLQLTEWHELLSYTRIRT